jgi:hypothetical protein
MQAIIGILAGVFVTGAASLCIGLFLFRRLAIQLERIESFSLAFVVGSACFSQIIFVLASMHLLRASAFIAIAPFAAAMALGVNTRIPAPVQLTLLPRRWKWFSVALFGSFGVVYLVNAMAPEMSPDGAAYHLPFVARYLSAHGFERIPGDFYGSLSQGIELLFLPAVSLGGHSSAALVHFLFLLDLPLLMICYGRRFGFPIPAIAAAFLVFASPLMGWDGTSAYVDVAAATVLFALFYLVQVWDVRRESGFLIPIGILAGFSYAVKYSAGIAFPYALGFICWRLWRGRKGLVKPEVKSQETEVGMDRATVREICERTSIVVFRSAGTVAAIAAIFVVPWMLKNAVQTGNPLAPFANHLFPNPYVHVSFEQDYRANLRHYHLTNWVSAPWELAVKGERLQGFFGPVFLLMPLALLSLRRPAGRRLLLAGTVFALPWLLNIGSRFLIPALPLLALALALAIERPKWLLPAVMTLHGLLSWYASPVRYFDRYAPRLAALPLRAALRIESEDAYLARSNIGYLIDRMIEAQVPPGNRVFSFEPIPEAWTTREIMAAQDGAESEVVADVLRTALVSRDCPMRTLDFQFSPRFFRRVRAVQTARLPGEMWSVSEFQMLEGGKPLVPDGNWRLNANPNRWDVPLAFDGNLITRWRSWEEAAPGMFLESDFGKPKLLDEVRLLVSSDALSNHLRLRGAGTDGVWRDLPAPRSAVPLLLQNNPRAEATHELAARGIHYLLVTPTTFGANDFDENAAAWGMRMIAESPGAHLYRLDPNCGAPELAGPITASIDASVPPGAYDDADSRIRLRAPWVHDPQFQDAYRHTLTYSNIPEASISLAFSGNAITYIYTRASNRGIAEVWVDDRLKGRVDLYAPATSWKSRQRFEGLGPGEHVIEIRVTGERNPRSTGSFVDLDALIVE